MEYLLITLFIVIFICLAFGCPIKIQITHKHEHNEVEIPEVKENEELPTASMDDVIRSLNETMEVFRDE